MEPRKIQSEADARRCLAAAETSGVPRVAWAHAHGIDARSLNAWRLNLSRGEAVRSRPVAPRPGLRLVELLATTPCVRPAYRVRCGPFEVDVPGEVDAERLSQLLRVMAASC